MLNQSTTICDYFKTTNYLSLPAKQLLSRTISKIGDTASLSQYVTNSIDDFVGLPGMSGDKQRCFSMMVKASRELISSGQSKTNIIASEIKVNLHAKTIEIRFNKGFSPFLMSLKGNP